MADEGQERKEGTLCGRTVDGPIGGGREIKEGGWHGGSGRLIDGWTRRIRDGLPGNWDQHPLVLVSSLDCHAPTECVAASLCLTLPFFDQLDWQLLVVCKQRQRSFAFCIATACACPPTYDLCLLGWPILCEATFLVVLAGRASFQAPSPGMVPVKYPE